MLTAPAKRRVFVLAFAVSGIALVALSAWLLWPVYKEYSASQRLLNAVRFGDQDSVDVAVAELRSHRWQGIGTVPELTRLTSSPTAGVRWRAAYAIGELGEAMTRINPTLMRDRAVPVLIRCLDDESIRRRAAYALGQIGPEARAAIPQLMDGLESNDPYFTGHAAEALARIGQPAMELLLEAAASGAGQRSIHAIDVLGLMGATELSRRRTALVSAFKSGDHAVRVHAAEALSRCGNAAVPDLIQLIELDSYLVSKELGDIGPDARDAIPVLLDTIIKSRPNGHLGAANAIGRIGGMSELMKALDVEAARSSVIQAIANRGDTAQVAIPKLVQILKTDDRANVRIAVIRVFQNMGSAAAEVVPTLIELLDSEPTDDGDVRKFRDIRYSIVVTLPRIGLAATTAVPALVRIWHSELPNPLRFAAAIALGELDPENPEVIPAMIEILTQKETLYERTQALQILRSRGPDSAPAVAVLIEELKANDRYVLMAIDALGAIGPGAAAAVEPLSEFLSGSEQSNAVLGGAVRALGSIGPAAKSALPQLTVLAQRPGSIDSKAVMRAIANIDPDGEY